MEVKGLSAAKRTAAVILIIIMGVSAMFGSFGCFAKHYKVDYCGQKGCYNGARDSYRAGRKVTLYYELIATDTDYSFTLDGEPLDFKYDEKHGFVLTFTMPDHDVKLSCSSRNSMEYEPKLVEFSNGICGTDGFDRGERYTMYYWGEDKVKIEIVITQPKSTESEVFLVPYEAYERCLEVIEENKMYKWNDMYPEEPICGGYTCVNFDHDGKSIHISDCLPPNGKTIMFKIRDIMIEFAEADSAEKL